MRKTWSGAKTSCTTLLSSSADFRSWPKGFSMTARRQEPLDWSASPCFFSCWTTTGKNRRHGQVEGEVAARALRLVELLDRGAQPLERVVVVEGALDEAHPLDELLPDLLAERRTGVLLDRVVDLLREVLVLPLAACEADQREARRQQAPVGEVVHGGHELFSGQIARDAEDDQARRPRDTREPSVCGVTERVRSGTRQGVQPSEGARRLSSASVDLSRSFQAASNFSTPSSSSSWTTSS